jgi:hypothetical protein
MSNKSKRENAAANAVASHLATTLGTALTAHLWDDGSRDAMHDFYLEGNDFRIALEVTTIADGRRVGRDIRWSDEVPNGWLEVDGLVGCWTAYHEGDFEASDVVREVRTHLPSIEGLGLAQIETRSWQADVFAPESRRPSSYAAFRALDSVGIVRASRVADALMSDHGGAVHIFRGFGTERPLDRNFPVTVINEQLREPSLHRSDVQKLLAVDDVSARHLWLWVELGEGLAMIRSFETEGLPDVDLNVEGIDGVWLGRGPSPNIVAGYLWLRGLGWSEFSGTRDEVIGD